MKPPMFRILLLIAILLNLMGMKNKPPTTLVCATGGNFSTIQAAVNQASAGAVIEVCNGVYTENIKINKSNLTLTSQQAAGKATYPVIEGRITIERSGFSISGFSIKSNENAISSSDNASGSYVFQNIHIHSKKNGINLSHGNTHLFKNIEIENADNGIILGSNVSGQHKFESIIIKISNEGINISAGNAINFKNISIDTQDKGIVLGGNASGHHIFDNVSVNSGNEGINIYSGDAINFQTVRIDSQNKGIILGSNASGSHSFSGISVSSKNEGINIANGSAIRFNKVKIISQGKGIVLGSNVTGNHSFENINVSSTKESLEISNMADRGNISNACITSSQENAIVLSRNTQGLTIDSSILRSPTDKYSVIFNSDNHDNKISGNCFYSCPRSNTSQRFGENYWALACNGKNNIKYGQVLNSCPVQEESCYVPPAPPVDPSSIGSFNAFEPEATGIVGVIKTKIAGQAFTLDVIAVDEKREAVAKDFTGNVKIELIDISKSKPAMDTNCPADDGASIPSSTQTLIFKQTDQGRMSTAFMVTDAWRNVKVRMSYPAEKPTVVACSNDNFAIRPDHLQVSAHDKNWQEAGAGRALYPDAGNLHKAGQPFQLKVAPANALGERVAGYGTPSSLNPVLECRLQETGCTTGNLLLKTNWSSTGNNAFTAIASYSEAGDLKLILKDEDFAAVDAAAGDTPPEERFVTGEVMIGRFVPDHFTLDSPNRPTFRTFGSECTQRSFTYIGQSFDYASHPRLKVAARNAQKNITTNHRGNAWNSLAIVQTYTSSSPLTASRPSSVILAAGAGTAQLDLGKDDRFVFERDNALPQAPLDARISLRVEASQSFADHTGQVDNIAVVSLPYSFGNIQDAGIAFDAGNTFRYGQLRLANAHGSDRVGLPVPVSAHYWDGSRFVPNTDDHCTTVPTSALAFSDWQGSLVNAEAARRPGLPGPDSVIALQNGRSQILLTKPAATMSAPGGATLCINLGDPANGNDNCQPSQDGTSGLSAELSWLKAPPLTTPLAGLRDPASRVTFGVFKSGPVIYRRENY